MWRATCWLMINGTGGHQEERVNVEHILKPSDLRRLGYAHVHTKIPDDYYILEVRKVNSLTLEKLLAVRRVWSTVNYSEENSNIASGLLS